MGEDRKPRQMSMEARPEGRKTGGGQKKTYMDTIHEIPRENGN